MSRQLHVSPDKISIQLYTLRNLFAADLEGTMSALADIGYRKVEMAGTHGRSAAEFRRILDRNHLHATSSHVGIDGIDGIDLDQAIADARTLGNRRVVHPFSRFATIAEWQEFAARLEAAGQAFRRAGVPLGYHNHAHEFVAIDGAAPYDVITHGTSRRNVHLELDLYWAVAGEQDPVRVFVHNAGRVRQFHVKDRGPDGGFADLGEGTIDFPRIFRATYPLEVDEYIVENDDPVDALACADTGFRYLRDIRF